ncbi:MAG: hypothetical protein J6C86_08775 [Bacteroidaceae bacterium]|nr:hypothetical protein [Bacteroidaceae bacterium]
MAVAFNRLLRRYRATSPNREEPIYLTLKKTMMQVYSIDNQHGNLASPLS